MEQLNNNEYNILVVEDDKEIRDGPMVSRDWK